MQGREGLLLYCGLGLSTSLVVVTLGLRWPVLLPGLLPPLASPGVWRWAQRRLGQPAPSPSRACLLGASIPQEEIRGYTDSMERSLETADNQCASRRWLLDVGESCKRRRERDNDGRPMEVGVRPIPSGLAAQMPLPGHHQPVGCSPACQQWLEQLLPGAAASRRCHAEAAVALAGGRPPSDPLGRRCREADRQPRVGLRACAGVDPAESAAHRQLHPYQCSPDLDFMHTLLRTTAGHAGNARSGEAPSKSWQGSWKGRCQNSVAIGTYCCC